MEKNMYTLQSDRLRVDVSEPGVAPNVTTRFDRAGFVEEVVLDGIHRFCASEPRNLSHKSSGGRGICNEYKCGADAKARVGEYFLKPGVGLLLKETDGPYNFANCYKTVPFKIEVSHVENAILFVTPPDPCDGYALRQEKRLEVTGNRLDMRIKLSNEGEKDFIGEEYCHNFLTVNNMSLGPDYTLEFPAWSGRGEATREGRLRVEGNALTFTGPLERAEMFLIDAGEFTRKPGDAFEWIFQNRSEGAFVRAREQINLSRVALWAADHMFSTESFHAIKLAPSESDSWTRSWEFGAAG